MNAQKCFLDLSRMRVVNMIISSHLKLTNSNPLQQLYKLKLKERGSVDFVINPIKLINVETFGMSSRGKRADGQTG